MTAPSVELFLPCTPLVLKVQFSAGPTYLEQVCLRAISAGIDHISHLNEMLPMGTRPLYDLLFGLWKQGYVLIDPQSGHVGLSTAVDLRHLDKLRSTSTEQTIEIAQERLTGRFLPRKGGRAAGRREYRLPAQIPFELKPEMYAEIVRAVGLAGRGRRGAATTAAAERSTPDIRIDPEAVRLGGAQRWLRVRVDCVVEEATDQLRIFLLDNLGLDGLARQGIERALDELAHDRPDDPPFNIMRQQARALSARAPVAVVVEHLAARTERLHDVDPGLVASLHDELVGLTRQAASGLAAAERAQAKFELVVGREDHERRIVRAIGAARHQLLLCCPFVDFQALQRLQQPLRDALGRGVQVHLMWGISITDTLDDSWVRLIDDIGRSRRGLLHVSRRSCRTHAKLVVSDHGEALVTSYNFLSPSSSSTLEIGARVISPSLCSELLDWAVRNHTDHDYSRSIVTAPPEDEIVPSRRPLVAPELPALGRDDAVAPSDIRLWVEAWRRHAADIASTLASLDHQVNIVSNAEHVGFLWEAIRSAKQRLVIASDALRSDVVSERLFGALQDRLAKDGVEILLVYRRVEGRANDGQALANRLASLAERYPRSFEAVRAETHCKLLVWDERVVASSFNFLSFSGFYGVGSGQQRLRERSELGVMISDPEFADQVVDTLRARVRPSLPLVFRPAPRVAVPELPSRSGALARVREVIDAVRDVEQGARRRRFADHFRRSDAAWSDLDWIIQARLPDAMERDAVCACLYALPAGVDLDERDRRVGDLAAWAWGRSMFWEAAILIAALPVAGRPGLPSMDVAMLAATWGDTHGEERMTGLYDNGQPAPGDRLALALIASRQLILRGSHAAHRLLKLLVDEDPVIEGAVAPLTRWWATNHGDAFPVGDLQWRTDASTDEAERGALLDELRGAVDAALKVRHAFAVGTRTWARLVSPRGALGQLNLAISTAPDPSAVSAWLVEHPDMSWLLDHTARESNGADMEPIVGSRRKLSLDRLETARRAAVRWTKAASRGTPSAALAPRVAEASQAIASFGRSAEFWRAAEGEPVSAPLAADVLAYLRLWGVPR